MKIIAYPIVFLIAFLLFSSPVFSSFPFHRLSKDEVTLKQREVFKKYRNLDDRIAAFAEMRVGTPYLLAPLGEDDSRGPLFSTETADCTVFVLTTFALAMAQDYPSARNMMKKLNYHNPPVIGKKVVSYPNRYHFTYERLLTNPYFTDITTRLLSADKQKKAIVNLNVKSSNIKLLNIPWSKKVVAYYIPNHNITRTLIRSIAKRSTGVAFVREKAFKIGVVVSHEGFIIDGKYLIHADSVAKRVEKVDFLRYIADNSDYFDGVILFEFNEVGD